MKHYQETEIEFRRDEVDGEYPHLRGIIVHQYGGDIEECITKARIELRLGSNWKVVRSDDSR